ncbi:serine/arginine repetitive matrix protein 1 [Drosophila serrata]|uniref:serine/arginine repetitive matrix protein 1 n=1 Tax=Drosophila serrata TaxID=7274 RepID=UPI000A1D0C3F|nr:serine/arginine repetitive matrix protein 1 [Drosophila serrata]
MPQSRASVPTQSHSSSQVYSKPVLNERILENIWTMRPLGGTGGALKALAKNVAQHMNLNRSTLKRVVAQVVAEHHNLGQVDDYKGHMYYAKPERLNFLNLLAQSKEALDDLLLLDPRMAKKFHRKDQNKKNLKTSRVSSQIKFRPRSKTKLVASATTMPRKVSIPTPARTLGKGISTTKLVTAQSKRSPRKSVQTLKKMPTKTQPLVVVKDMKQEQRTASRTRSPFRSRSASPQVKTKRTSRIQKSSSSHHRLPAGSTRKTIGITRKPTVLATKSTKITSLNKIKSKSQVKTESKAKSPLKTKSGRYLKPIKGKSYKQVEKFKSEDIDVITDTDTYTDTEMEPKQRRRVIKSMTKTRSRSRSRSHSPKRYRSPSPKRYRSRFRRRQPSPVARSPSSTTTATTVVSRRFPKTRQQEETLTAKVLTKALTKALAKAFPQTTQSQVRAREVERSPEEAETPVQTSFRNYDKPWLVPKIKTRRLVAGSLERSEKKQQQKKQQQQKQQQRKQQKKQHHQNEQRQQEDGEEQDQDEVMKPRKSRTHVGHQMRKVDFPWYTPYQFQGGAGATQQPSPRSSSIPLMAKKRLKSHHLRREEGIDKILNYGSGLYRRHRGEWMPAKRTSSHHIPKERSKVTRRSSSLQARWKVTKRGKTGKKSNKKQAKPSIEGFHLPPPPPSAVSSDDRVRPRRRSQSKKPKPVESSLGSYADLIQPSDSKEAMKRSKRRLSIAFMSKHGRGSRHRHVPPVWK